MSNESRDMGEAIGSIVGKGKVIDLTMTIPENLPCYSPQGRLFYKTMIKRYNTPTESYVNNIYMTEHIGTHCDAPCHLIPPPDSGFPQWEHEAGKITAAEIPLLYCMGPAAVIDCREFFSPDAEESSEIPVSVVKKWESEHGGLKKGDVVLFYTGWADYYYDEDPEKYSPEKDCGFISKIMKNLAPNVETMSYVVGKGVRSVGIDGPSAGSLPNDQKPHRVILREKGAIVEKLINLGQLPPKGAYFIFLPMKIGGGSGAPGRAIAIV